MGKAFNVSGLVEMTQKLGGEGASFRQKLAAALYRRGEAVMTRSKEEFVPVDTGTLKASGMVRPPVWEGTNVVSVELVYGGPAAPYAVVQHETPTYRHRVGQWKYLETPLLEAAPSMAQDIADDLGWQS